MIIKSGTLDKQAGGGGGSETTESILEKLQGEEIADPARIGPEYLPEIIPADVQLSNTTGVTKAAGILGSNADGSKIFLHDDERLGGREVAMADMTLETTVGISNAAIAAGDVYSELGKITVPESWYVAGKVIYVFVNISINGTGYDGAGIALSAHLDGETGYDLSFEEDGEFYAGTNAINVTANHAVAKNIQGLFNFGISEPATDQFRVGLAGNANTIVLPVGAATAAAEAATEASAFGATTTHAPIYAPIVFAAKVLQDAAMSGGPLIISVRIKLFTV